MFANFYIICSQNYFGVNIRITKSNMGAMLKGKASLDMSKVVSVESNDTVENHLSSSKDDQKKPEKTEKGT